MKKTLVALAAMAATASFAQSSVTISGNLDVAIMSKSGTYPGANGTTVTTTDNGAATTSAIKFTATEDLGGGMKLTAFYELDPRGWVEDGTAITNQNNVAGTTSLTTSSVTSKVTGIGRGEAYIQLTGGFGNVQLGAPNAFGLGVIGLGTPLGTGVGSGYTFQGGTNSLMTAAVNTRYGRAFKYTSPTIAGGLTVGVQHAPGNDQSAAASSTGSLAIPNARQATEIALNYSKGPLNLGYVNISQAAQTNNTGWFLSGSGAGAAATSTNVFGANYSFGALTVYGAAFSGQSLASSATPNGINGMRGGIKYTMGNVDLMAGYTELRSKSAATATIGNETKATVTGLRADYNLSKTAAMYLAVEKNDTGTASNNQMDAVSIGMRKSF